jgi:hypothetical protein
MQCSDPDLSIPDHACTRGRALRRIVRLMLGPAGLDRGWVRAFPTPACHHEDPTGTGKISAELRFGSGLFPYESGTIRERLPPTNCSVSATNGIVVVDQPWQNLVATFTELNEPRTVPDVEDATDGGRERAQLVLADRSGSDRRSPNQRASDLAQVFQRSSWPTVAAPRRFSSCGRTRTQRPRRPLRVSRTNLPKEE